MPGSAEEPGAPRLEPSGGRGQRIARPRLAVRVTASGRWAARPERAYASASSTAGSSAPTRSSASVQRAVAVSRRRGRGVDEDDPGDVCGHGTACAGIVRALAPDCELFSVRVLGAGARAAAPSCSPGLRWAIEQGFDVINLSLSTTKREFAGVLHELADTRVLRRALLVASAHNMPVESFPWRFASVLSVGSHEGDDPFVLLQPDPPVEFFARGVDVDVAWLGGGRCARAGNSFATPHIAGICALILASTRGSRPSSSRACST